MAAGWRLDCSWDGNSLVEGEGDPLFSLLLGLSVLRLLAAGVRRVYWCLPGHGSIEIAI
jgi:hypothetical protein